MRFISGASGLTATRIWGPDGEGSLPSNPFAERARRLGILPFLRVSLKAFFGGHKSPVNTSVSPYSFGLAVSPTARSDLTQDTFEWLHYWRFDFAMEQP